MAGDLGVTPQHLRKLAACVAPVARDATCRQVVGRFADDAGLHSLAVVDAGRPVGLVARAGFMQRFESADAAAMDRPIALVMNANPLIVETDESLLAVHGRLVENHASALVDGFVVVEDGAYLGVGAALDLMRLTVAAMTDHAQELDQARRRAEQTSRAKSQFLANMSHELRTPLNAIIGFSEIIRDQTFGPVGSPQYRDYAHDIHSSGGHLLDLVNDILDLSKVEAGAIELHDELIDVADLIDSSVMLVRQFADRGAIRLAVDLPSVFPSLNADSRKLKQVLVNLLSNAVKFTPKGGEVRVAVSVGERLDISVTDTGIGMAPDDIPLALTPFKRIDGELNRTIQGTGLGLPLSKALIEAHGGGLTLASARDRGTTVTVSLPATRLVWPASELMDQAG
ncbi:MAG: ATP-binding protein [Alphaproteobacteria bacterium]